MNIFRIFLESSIAAQIIMTILIIFSIWSWAIFFKKLYDLSKVGKRSRHFLNTYRFQQKVRDFENLGPLLTDNPYGRILNSGIEEYRKLVSLPAANPTSGEKPPVLHELADNLRLAMEKTKIAEIADAEKLLPALSTFVSASPFLGLLGTVWGIMVAFLDIRTRGSAHITVVAPGISDALVTTVYGLLVAIPALIFYNIFRARVNKFETELNKYVNEVYANLRKQLLTSTLTHHE